MTSLKKIETLGAMRPNLVSLRADLTAAVKRQARWAWEVDRASQWDGMSYPTHSWEEWKVEERKLLDLKERLKLLDE